MSTTAPSTRPDLRSRDSYRVVEVTAYGGPGVLRPRTVPAHESAAGRARVLVTASTVNPVDIAARVGALAGFLPDLEPPFVLGWDLAGTLLDDAGDLPAATRVVGAVPWFAEGGRVGTNAEVVLADRAWLARAPDGVDDVVAAALPLNGLTARQALDVLRVESGQRVLVTGASGAVGAYAVTLAKIAGAEVVAQASTGDEEFVADLGADDVLPRSDAATLAGRVGTVDAVLDAAQLGPDLLPVLRDGGGFAVITGDTFASDRVRVERVGVVPDPDRLRELADQLAAGTLRTRVADVLPLSEAAEAHRRFEAGGLRGRLVLDTTA